MINYQNRLQCIRLYEDGEGHGILFVQVEDECWQAYCVCRSFTCAKLLEYLPPLELKPKYLDFIDLYASLRKVNADFARSVLELWKKLQEE